MKPPLSGHALVIDLAKIPVHGLTVDTEFVPEMTPEDELELTTPVRVQGRLTRVLEQIFFNGTVSGTVSALCSRCLDPVNDAFEAEVQVVFVPVGSRGTNTKAYDGDTVQDHGVDDLDLYLHDGIRLDLTPVVGEHAVMALPVQTLCREECSGLCQVCGINRNEQSCTCQVESGDARFSILKNMTIPESS